MSLANIHPDLQPDCNQSAHNDALVCPPQDVEGFSLSVTRGTVMLGGHPVEHLTVGPEGEPDPTKLMIVGGYLGFLAAYFNLQVAGAEAGIENIAFQQTRRYTNRQFSDTQSLQSKAAWQVLKPVIADSEDGKIDMLLHSWGSPIGLEIVRHHPELFRHVALVAPAGLTNTSLPRMIPRGARLLANVARRAPLKPPIELSANNLRQAIGHFLFNPARTMGEAHVASKSNIVPALEEIRELGIGVVLLQPERDELFDAGEVVDTASGLIDHIEVLPGVGHDAPIAQPEIVVDALVRYISGQRSGPPLLETTAA